MATQPGQTREEALKDHLEREKSYAIDILAQHTHSAEERKRSHVFGSLWYPRWVKFWDASNTNVFILQGAKHRSGRMFPDNKAAPFPVTIG